MAQLRLQSPPQQLMDALRQNVAILHELAAHYEVSRLDSHGELPTTTIQTPADAARLLAPEMEGLTQEQLRVLLLDKKNHVVGHHLVYQGSVNCITQIRTAEVFREAIVQACPSIIVLHNHPSGDPEPSPQDCDVTRQIREAGRILDIDLLDHIIIGRGRHVSLRERGVL